MLNGYVAECMRPESYAAGYAGDCMRLDADGCMRLDRTMVVVERHFALTTIVPVSVVHAHATLLPTRFPRPALPHCCPVPKSAAAFLLAYTDEQQGST